MTQTKKRENNNKFYILINADLSSILLINSFNNLKPVSKTIVPLNLFNQIVIIVH